MLTQDHGRISDCVVKGSTTCGPSCVFEGAFHHTLTTLFAAVGQYLRARDVTVVVSIGEGYLAKDRSTHEGEHEKPARAAQAALPRALCYPYHRAGFFTPV